jgi:hypothetical protein
MKRLALLCVFFLSVSLYAQEAQSDTMYVWKPSHIIFQFGAFAQSNAFAGFEKFRYLAPNSVILEDNIKSNYPYYGYSMDMHTNPFISLHTYFQPNAKSSSEAFKQLQVRVGLLYSGGSWLRTGGFREVKTRLDTLTSPNTGASVYHDSIYRREIFMNYRSERIMLDVMLVVPLFTGTRIFPYWGVGVTGGSTFNNFTIIQDKETIKKEYNSSPHSGSSNPFYSYGPSNGVDRQETVKNKSTLVTAFYVPMGLDLTIGKNHPILKRISLIAEIKAGIQSVFIPELYTIHKGFMQSSFGLRMQ